MIRAFLAAVITLACRLRETAVTRFANDTDDDQETDQ